MRKAYIYALVDPRSGKERYIGYATNLDNRVYQHINDSKLKRYLPDSTMRDVSDDAWMCDDAKSDWIRELLAIGLKPAVSVLLVVPQKGKAYYEGFWGEIFADESLLNIKPFYKNLQTTG